GRAGRLSSYCPPLAVSRSELAGLERLERRANSRPASAAVSLLRRRATPPPVTSEQISRVANLAEIVYVLGVRLGAPDLVWSALTRNRAAIFDRAVARRLHPALAAVIGYHSTAQKTFEAARNNHVPTVLDYPIPPYQ